MLDNNKYLKQLYCEGNQKNNHLQTVRQHYTSEQLLYMLLCK